MGEGEVDELKRLLMNTLYKVQARSRGSEGGELDSQEAASPEDMSREVVLGYRERVGLLLQLFPNGGATDIVLVTLFCIAVGTAMAWYCCH